LTASSEQPAVSFQSLAFAVGQDKHSLSLVRRTAFSRREYSPRRFVTKFFQLSNDFSESKADVSFDVFKEADSGLENANSTCDVGPQVSWVFCSESLSGCAEWLAGITSSEDVHAATKLCPREGFKIRPDRCWVHESRFHFCDQVRAGEGFDLTKSDCAQSWEHSFESKFNAAISGTKSKMSDLGSIHIYVPVGLIPPVESRPEKRRGTPLG
jgi:hypothetical protein